MDYHDHIDLEDLPSDAFGISDIDHDQPLDVNDFSSWPAHSSPAPLHELEEGEYYDEEADQDYEDHGDDDLDSSVDEEEEQDEQEEQDEGDAVVDEDEEDVFEYVLAGEDELLSFHGEPIWNPEAEIDDYGDFDDYDEAQHNPNHSRAASRGFDGLLPQIRVGGAGRLSEAPSDSLFVDQNQDPLPPIASLLSDVARNQARALELMSEIQAEARRPRPSRSPGISLARGSIGPSREANNFTNHRHRHHPYDNMATRGGRSAERGGRGNSHRPRDELVALEMQPTRPATRRSRTTPPAQAEVIDLTGEPDSPQEVRLQAFQARARPANPSQNVGRNPRRQTSLSQRTPSLARSENNALQDNSNFIDLTLDDTPAPPPLPQHLPRRVTLNHIHHHHHHHRPSRASSRVQPIDLESQDDALQHPPFPGLADFVRAIPGFGFVHRRLAGGFHHYENPPPAVREAAAQLIIRRGDGSAHNIDIIDNPLAGNIPILNYRGNGHGEGGGGGRAKPAHVPPPPAREGFTRNTGVEDEVVVCAGCEGELKYDPDEGGVSATGNAPSSSASTSAPQQQQRPAKKPRTRKDQEEHHFWALKECGHVYCRECYDSRSRRPSSKSAATSHFRRGGDNNRKVLCAVEGCASDANNKLNWVGLFL